MVMKRDDALTDAENLRAAESRKQSVFTLRFREKEEEREIREKSFLFDKNGLQ